MPFPFEYRQSIRFDQRTLTKKVIPYNSEGIRFPRYMAKQKYGYKNASLYGKL